MANEKRIIILKHANRLFQQGKTDPALDEYKKILEIKPDDLQVRRIVGDIELKRSNLKEAVEQFEWIADHYLKSGLSVRAIATYKRIIRISPDHQDIRLKLADLYSQEELYSEAQQIYLDFAKKYQHQGLRQKTREMYHKILEFQKADIPIRLLLADSYLEDNHPQEAVNEYITAVDIILENKEYKRAEELLLNTLMKVPEIKVLEKLLHLYIVNKEDDKIIDLIGEHGLDGFQDIKTLKVAAELCMEKSRLPEAEKIVLKIVERAPGDIEILMRLANAYINRDEFDRGYQLFLPLVDKQIQEKKFEEAANLLRFLIAANNSYLPALNKLADVFKLSGQINSLIALYESLLPIYEERGMKDQLKNLLEELCQLSDTPANYQILLDKLTNVPTSETEEPPAKSDPEIEVPGTNVDLELEYPVEKGIDDMFESDFLAVGKNPGNLGPEDSDIVMEYQEEKTGGSLEIPAEEISSTVMDFDSDEDLLTGESFFLDDDVYFENEKNAAEELKSLRLFSQARHGFPVPLPQPGESKSQVICTVFSPPAASPGSEILIQVFTYLYEKFKEAQLKAIKLSEGPASTATATSPPSSQQGTELVLEMRMREVSIKNPIRRITWNGSTDHAAFAVQIPGEVTQSSLIGRVIISPHRIPIGTIPFRLKIQKNSDSISVSKRPQPLGDITIYRYPYISYAPEDKEEVSQRLKKLSSLEVSYFQEILARDSNDTGVEKLIQKITKADAFFLFWSKASLQSEWVKKEISIALLRQNGSEEEPPEIIPVLLGDPPFPGFPPVLKHICTDEETRYFAST
jgi:tetratricopeptide (TPR) repeat protein